MNYVSHVHRWIPGLFFFYQHIVCGHAAITRNLQQQWYGLSRVLSMNFRFIYTTTDSPNLARKQVARVSQRQTCSVERSDYDSGSTTCSLQLHYRFQLEPLLAGLCFRHSYLIRISNGQPFVFHRRISREFCEIGFNVCSVIFKM